MIELDQLLSDCTHDEAMEFFRLGGEFHEEEYLVGAINKHLRTNEDRALLYKHDISIEDILNGRVSGEERHKVVEDMMARWNIEIGAPHFSY